MDSEQKTSVGKVSTHTRNKRETPPSAAEALLSMLLLSMLKPKRLRFPFHRTSLLFKNPYVSVFMVLSTTWHSHPRGTTASPLGPAWDNPMTYSPGWACFSVTDLPKQDRPAQKEQGLQTGLVQESFKDQAWVWGTCRWPNESPNVQIHLCRSSSVMNRGRENLIRKPCWWFDPEHPGSPRTRTAQCLACCRNQDISQRRLVSILILNLLPRKPHTSLYCKRPLPIHTWRKVLIPTTIPRIRKGPMNS